MTEEELYNEYRKSDCKSFTDFLINKITELQDELKKWKDGIVLKDEEIGCIETDFNTFKSRAKEIIREFVEWANWQGSKCPSFKSIQDKAEQFLKENE